jgi:hypothetical protein
MIETETEKHSIVEMDQLRVLLRTLDHRFGSEVLYREVRSILAESKSGSQQMEETDRPSFAAEADSSGREDMTSPDAAQQKAASAWENAVRAASQPARTNTREGQNQGKLAAARRALGG